MNFNKSATVLSVPVIEIEITSLAREPSCLAQHIPQIKSRIGECRIEVQRLAEERLGLGITFRGPFGIAAGKGLGSLMLMLR